MTFPRNTKPGPSCGARGPASVESEPASCANALEAWTPIGSGKSSRSGRHQGALSLRLMIDYDPFVGRSFGEGGETVKESVWTGVVSCSQLVFGLCVCESEGWTEMVIAVRWEKSDDAWLQPAVSPFGSERSAFASARSS